MGKRKTTAEFIEEANRVHNGKYSYEHTIYTNSQSKVIVTCPIHGDFGGEEGFRKRVELDAIKNRKCKDNGFQLFRLRYDYTEDDFYDTCVAIKELILKHNAHE